MKKLRLILVALFALCFMLVMISCTGDPSEGPEIGDDDGAEVGDVPAVTDGDAQPDDSKGGIQMGGTLDNYDSDALDYEDIVGGGTSGTESAGSEAAGGTEGGSTEDGGTDTQGKIQEGGHMPGDNYGEIKHPQYQ